MNTAASFGGSWTEEKLKRLDKYLRAYTRIFDSNPRARFLTTIYVDAFASTGSRVANTKEMTGIYETTEQGEPEAQSFLKGSARIALEVEPKFDRYLFIERNTKRAKELNSLRTIYPDRADSIQIENADANGYLKQWCATTDWSKTRAVLFLDPFGMQVEWSLLETIAKTQAIDVWLLFPIGMGVNRLLTKSQPPPEAWAASLTKVFGTDEWRSQFYPATLFDDLQSKETNFDRIASYFVSRLKIIFPAVADNPLLLRNSINVPLYLLCFAAGSNKDSVKKAALRIAQDILRR